MNGINYPFIKSNEQELSKDPLGNTTRLYFNYSTAIFLLSFSPKLIIKVIGTVSHYFCMWVTLINGKGGWEEK